MNEIRPMTREERIARIAHEVNRAYCEAIGDHSQMSWAEAPDFIRDSVVSGVKMHLNKEVNPGESHQAWLEYKLAEGWEFGCVKDIMAKRHPNLVPFQYLPLAEQIKDFLFTATVKALKHEIEA